MARQVGVAASETQLRLYGHQGRHHDWWGLQFAIRASQPVTALWISNFLFLELEFSREYICTLICAFMVRSL